KPEPSLYKISGRPKIGLVLSGGGARGVAHIGVLKVLEELRVPVDMVLGTSMGSLVGGIYASGLTPEELEAKVRLINWDTIFKDDPPRQQIPWQEKRDDYTSLFALEFGFRDGKILLPYGTTAGYKFEFLMTDMVGLAAGREARNFDSLPIPYRAVAMDLEDGSMKVFDSGVLVKAMRASMSVPAFIAPANIDGHLYVDGGMVRNLPVDVARRAGCEIIIAVNLGTPPLRRDQLTSVAAVALQSINLMTEHNVQRSLAELTEKDILIKPALGEFSSGDFTKAMDTIPIGIAAARAVQDKLERLSVSEDDYKAWQLSLAERKPADVRVADIEVEKNMKWVNPVVIEAEIEKKPGIMEYLVTKQPGEKEGLKKLEEIPSAMKKKDGEEMNLQQLQNTLTTIYGRGDFELMDYSLVKKDGKETILVEGVEKPWGPDYLKFGLGFATDMSTPVRFNIAASYRKTWLNRYGAEWRTDAQLGYTKGLYTEFFQPVGVTAGSFVAPWAGVAASPVNYYFDGTYLGQYGVVKTRGGLDLGIQGKVGMIRLGFYQGYVSANSEFGLLQLPDFNRRQGGFMGRFAIDQLDDADFPREGILIAGNYFGTDEAFGAQDSYNKYELVLRKPFAFGPHSLNVGLAYADNAGSALPPYDPFAIGGFLNLSGYKFNQLVGQGYSFGEIVYMYQFGSLPSPLGKGLYVGGSLETGQVHHLFDPKANNGWLFGSSVFFAADTIFGPFYGAFGYAGDGSTSFYVMLSRPWTSGR
ncbi:MAG TPA: patatin-like phospholipase family protein, partial [Syntrophales bacterium]|nr:patatin-like phospholipase family protein [Syntrophales bacterium]